MSIGKIIKSVSLSIIFAVTLFADNGVYVSVGVGVNTHSDSDITSNGATTASFEHDKGHFFNATIGYAYSRYRIDVELFNSQNKVNNIILGSNSAEASGSAKTYAQFVNVYYDYPLDDAWEIYGGLGAGRARLRLDSVRNETANVTIANGDDSAVAYQIKFGGAYSIREHLRLTLEGRYFRSGEMTYEDLASNTSFNIQSDEQISFGIGLNYRFIME